MGREWSPHLIEPLGPGLRMQLRLRSLSPDTSLSFLSYGAAVRVEPAERADVVLVQMPARGSASACFPETEIALHPDAFAAIDVRRMRQASFSADYQMRVLRVRVSRLERTALALLGHPPRGVLRFSPGLSRGSPAWRGWQPLAAALAALDEDPDDVPAAVLAPLEEAALCALLLTQRNSYSADLARPVRSVAPRQVVRAEHFIRENLHLPLTSALIADHVEISLRALFDAFRTFRGMSPATYVRQARLERAREDLIDGTSSVAAVAGRWGFSHAPTFTAHYRERYGETPGATRRFGRSASRH